MNIDAPSSSQTGYIAGRPGLSPRQPVVVPLPQRRPGRPGAPRNLDGLNPLVRAVLMEFPNAVVVEEKWVA